MAKLRAKCLGLNSLLVAMVFPMLFIAGCGGKNESDITGVTKAARITVTDLGTLGGTGSYAFAINARGQIAGSSAVGTSLGEPHGFIWHNGVMTDLGERESLFGEGSIAEYVSPSAINDLGQVAGRAVSPFYGTRTFLWQGGVWTVIAEAEGLTDCLPRKINNSGQVVGHCGKVPEYGGHAFFWENGVMTDLGLGAAEDINDKGQVTGVTYAPFGANGWYELHAFIWESGVMTDLGTLGAAAYSANRSYGRAINNSGQVVGTTSTPVGDRAFIWENGVMKEIGTLPSGSDSYATAINDTGQVAGSAYTAPGIAHPFIWKGGVMTDLGMLPGQTMCDPVAMNIQGKVIGHCWSYSSDYNPYVGFIWQGGVMTELKGVDGSKADPVGINDSGDVAGNAGGHAMLWSIK